MKTDRRKFLRTLAALPLAGKAFSMEQERLNKSGYGLAQIKREGDTVQDVYDPFACSAMMFTAPTGWPEKGWDKIGTNSKDKMHLD